MTVTLSAPKPSPAARACCAPRWARRRRLARRSGVVEVMVNPDGGLWLDRLGTRPGRHRRALTPADGERIIRLVAHHVGAEVHAGAPRVSAELPENAASGSRACCRRSSTAPGFAIRKPAVAVFTLARLCRTPASCRRRRRPSCCAQRSRERAEHPRRRRHVDRQDHARQRAARRDRSDRDERVILIEDTRELQCAAPNLVALRTKAGVATLADLVRSTLRLRPDRIPSARCAAPRRSTCSRPGTPAIPAASAPSMPAPPCAALHRLEQLDPGSGRHRAAAR